MGNRVKQSWRWVGYQKKTRGFSNDSLEKLWCHLLRWVKQISNYLNMPVGDQTVGNVEFGMSVRFTG